MRIFNLDIEYIHISHLKSFPIPVEIQNWFYNISFIFTTLHFRKSFKFSQQKIHTINFFRSLLTPTSNNNIWKSDMIKYCFVSGLVMLLLVFLSGAYLSKEAQSETIAAEKMVGFHKRLQQVNDFEPVRFLPARLVRHIIIIINTCFRFNTIMFHFDD